MVWKEGLTKFPHSGWCWEQFAKNRQADGDYGEAVVAASVVLELKPRGSDLQGMQLLVQRFRNRIPANEQAQAEKRLANISSELDRMQNLADAARQEKRKSMTDEFATYLSANASIKSSATQYEVVEVDSFFKDSPGHETGGAELASRDSMSDSRSGSASDSVSGDDFESIDDFLAEDNERSAKQLLDQVVENRKQGNSEQADNLLAKLLERYPDTTSAKTARQMSGMEPGDNPAAQGGTRTWSDKTGHYKVEAAFLDRLGDTIRLENGDGKIITLKMDQLSSFDQRYIEKNHPDK